MCYYKVKMGVPFIIKAPNVQAVAKFLGGFLGGDDVNNQIILLKKRIHEDNVDIDLTGNLTDNDLINLLDEVYDEKKKK